MAGMRRAKRHFFVFRNEPLNFLDVYIGLRRNFANK